MNDDDDYLPFSDPEHLLESNLFDQVRLWMVPVATFVVVVPPDSRWAVVLIVIMLGLLGPRLKR